MWQYPAVGVGNLPDVVTINYRGKATGGRVGERRAPLK